MGSSSQADEGQVHIRLSYRGQNQDLALRSSNTLRDLHDFISEKTSVLPIHQKIITSGPIKKVFASKSDDELQKTLAELGFPIASSSTKPPIRLMLVGPSEGEVESIRKEDELGVKMNAPRKYHPSMLRGTKPRSTIGNSSTANSNPFHSLRVHKITTPSAPEYDLVMSRLRKLSTDEAVLHVCRLHGFQVGELTELLPHEHPNLLGLNENMGQRISLRLRTDLYDGLQPYRDTRRVLLHELAHNKVNDHPPEFKILNSELNAQVEAFERNKQEGTHRLVEMDVYVPTEDEPLANGGNSNLTTHVLGGESLSSSSINEDVGTKRARILQATMRRLEKVEAEIERGCGSGI